jgi:hypothetical protein
MNTILELMEEIDVTALQLEVERSKAARLRAWTAEGYLDGGGPGAPQTG